MIPVKTYSFENRHEIFPYMKNRKENTISMGIPPTPQEIARRCFGSTVALEMELAMEIEAIR